MHVPDHFLDDPTSATTAVVSLAAVGYAAYRAREDLTPRRVALTAATTGFVFAVQMLNYPVAAGTNVLLMAVVGTLVGWAVTRGVLRATRGRGAAAAAGTGALVSVPVSAAVFA